MKNSIKIILLAITVLFFFAACKGNKSLNAGDSTKIDSSSISATAKSDSTKTDSAKAKTDSVRAVKKKK
jgi:hypothetical protein